MALDRLQQTVSHVLGKDVQPQRHPLDPLTADEITTAVNLVRKEHGDLAYNSVTLREPPKDALLSWLRSPNAPAPSRVADVIASAKGSKLYDGLVDLDYNRITKWERAPEGVHPSITMEDLQIVETIIRKDPKVIEQCGILGIPPEDMHKVYCDPWTIGYDERYDKDIRLQQGIMYYRPSLDDNQYTYPLDFCPIYNIETQEVIHIDIPDIRRPLNKAPPSNYDADAVKAAGGLQDLKPLHITQPDGVSFSIEGRMLKWQKWSLHVGFNYREGIVLSNVTFNDRGTVRPVFWRISLAEMIVPYGHPTHPHHRKHAFDIGEYGAGYMTNSLSRGCDCKGEIRYMDATMVSKAGKPITIPNAICIHEEDSGILVKHTDFRDESCTLTRARRLVISHIFTAGNYEYCIYWILHQDGVIQLDIKLTGILSTYAMYPGENAGSFGTQVYPGVNAHHHQHLFCLRLDPSIDGQNNTVFQVDAVPSEAEVGSEENRYGNAFYPQKTKISTVSEGQCQYSDETSRTWEIANTSKTNPYSGKPVAYKLVSRDVPRLMPKRDSLVWKRAGFARNAVHVTPYSEDQIYPAGRHVPQNPGEPSQGLPAWIEAAPNASVDDTDIVLWHTFGVTHFASPEDYPIMPVETMSVLLRPRNFFTQNPALDVPPTISTKPTDMAVNAGRR